ncbi:MAG: acyl-CoA dehydrogenase family protein [Aestuariivirgaceae bacterium]
MTDGDADSNGSPFTLPPEAAAWARRVRNFVDGELVPCEEHAELNEGRLPEGVAERHEQLALQLGLSRADVPRRFGGLGLTILAQVAIAEQLGRVTNALSWCFPEAQAWMFEAFDADQIDRYALPLMRGERHFCYAITEENAGSDPSEIATTATREGGHYLVSGEKWHVTSFNLVDTVIVQARIGNGPNAGAHSLFFCPVDADGLRVVRSPAYAHTYNHHHPVIAFDQVRIPLADRIGPEGDGMSFAQAWFRRERLMIAARCCGAAERLIEAALDFAKTRVVSGQPIAEFQLIQAMLADSVLELHAARLVTREAAAAHDCRLDVKELHARCALAKLHASEMAWRVADRVVQIFGGRGYMRENVAERFLRELRVDRIWEGTSEIQRLIIARGLLKRGLRGVIGAN